jgi:hypothetical protein
MLIIDMMESNSQARRNKITYLPNVDNQLTQVRIPPVSQMSLDPSLMRDVSQGDICVKCQKQAFSFNKREAKVYFYAFLHVLKRDTCIKHEQTYFKK